MITFKRNPTTIKEVYDNTVADAVRIQNANKAKLDKLSKEQKARQEEFDLETASNVSEQLSATTEISMASKAIDGFRAFFSIEGEEKIADEEYAN